MKRISHDELEPGMVVVITKAPPSAPGFTDRLFKVMAVDPPYVVLRLGRDVAASTYMIRAAEAEFALPERETLAAMMPDSILDAEVVGEE